MDAIAETKERPHAEILGPDAAFLRRNRLAGVIAQHLSRANQDGEPGPALSHDRPPGTGDFELCAGETDTDPGEIGRASGRESVCQDVEVWVVAVASKKKKKKRKATKQEKG